VIYLQMGLFVAEWRMRIMGMNIWKRSTWRLISRVMVSMVLLLMVTPRVSAAAEYVSLYRYGYKAHVAAAIDSVVLSGEVAPTGTARLSFSPGSIPDAFRLFIPPGTVSVSISLFTNERHGVPLALRYQQPPMCSYCRTWDVDTWDYSPKFDEMTDHDVYTGGRSFMVEDRFSPVLDVGGSGWLYGYQQELSDMSISIEVDLATFVAWYNDPETIWDVNGDPWSANNEIAPLQACDRDHLDVCQESNCHADGEGYWYNDVKGGPEYCHAMPPDCDGDDCLTESQCLSADADLYWYKDDVDGEPTCHPMPACQRDWDTGAFVEECTPVNCITAAQCEDADLDFYWYNDVEGDDEYCHATPPDCDGDDCLTESQCLSADADLYWYKDDVDGEPTCHPMPACQRDRDTGAFVEECIPENCITPAQCEDAGPDFYWYDDVCHAEPEQGVCSQDNLSGCITEAECVAAHGEWHNYSAPGAIKCTERSSYTYAPPPSSSPPSTSTGTSGVSGLNWFSFLSASQTAPAPVTCSSQHLEACDQAGCESLGDGYWWYGGACRNEPVEVDFNHDRHGAPVSPGNDADDGVVSAGEGLSFKVSVAAGVRMYAALSIPNVGSFFISNDKIITVNMEPVTSGPIPVADDICPYLTDDLMGTWTVYTLTVPASVGESLDELSDYLFQQGGLYAFSSYQIEVNCQQQSTTTAGPSSDLYDWGGPAR